MNAQVALAGCAGPQKTSLGRALAEHTGLPYIEESVVMSLDEALDFESEARRRRLEELWERQDALEQDAGVGFISARSSLDFAAFWFHYAYDIDADATELWMTRMCAAAERYDRILLLPWGMLPADIEGAEQSRWSKFRFQALLEGLINRFSKRGQLLRLPGSPELQKRVEYVLRYL